MKKLIEIIAVVGTERLTVSETAFAIKSQCRLESGAAPRLETKNLSVNNVYARWHVAEADDRGGEHVESHE